MAQNVEQSFTVASESWEIVIAKSSSFLKELACRGKGHSWSQLGLLMWEVTREDGLVVLEQLALRIYW